MTQTSILRDGGYEEYLNWLERQWLEAPCDGCYASRADCVCDALAAVNAVPPITDADLGEAATPELAPLRVTYRHRLYRIVRILATAVVLEDRATGQQLVVGTFGPQPAASAAEGRVAA